MTVMVTLPSRTARASLVASWRLASLALVAIGGSSCFGEVQAQNVVPLAERPFKESLVGNPKVSGNVLVGLSLGESSRAVDPTTISVDLSTLFSDRRVCAQISSRDGRYWAENVYELPRILGSAQLEWGTRFATELAHFTYNDIAVIVRDVPNCLASELGSIVPIKLAGGDEMKLVAYVNPGSARVRASLSKDGSDVVGATACTRIEEGVRIAYSMRCILPLPERITSGRYELRLSLREATGVTPITMSVLIP